MNTSANSQVDDVNPDELDLGLPTSNPIANVYFEAAERIGYRIDILSEHHGVGKIANGDKSLDIFGRWVGINDITANMLCGNKGYASGEMAKAGLQVPSAQVIDVAALQTIEARARAILNAAAGRYPLCLKPVTGTHGMQVVPDIRDEEELLRVLFEDNKVASLSGMIESQCQGRHYRVIVAFGEVIGCVERTPPAVTGDGTATLQALVERYNRQRRLWNLVPATIEARQEFIIQRRHGVALEDVVQAGQAVVLDDRCNLKVGGNIQWLAPDSLATSAVDSCARAAEIFDLEFAGVDLICDDVTDNGGETWMINEVNSQPAAHVPVPTMTRDQRLDWPTRLLTRVLS